jgi:hypothetical protein
MMLYGIHPYFASYLLLPFALRFANVRIVNVSCILSFLFYLQLTDSKEQYVHKGFLKLHT